MIRYEHSAFVESIAKELIEKHTDLQHIKNAAPNIAYMEADHGKKKAGNTVFADCEKVKPKMKEFMNYDYVITVYTPNCEALSPNQWKLLIYHELLHVDCLREADGNLVCKIRPHDVGEFNEVADRFGTHWTELADVEDILEGL